MRGTPKGRRGVESLLALDTGEQGGQHGLDLHGGAGAHDGLPLVLEQLRHILWVGRKGAGTLVRPWGRDEAPPQAPTRHAGPRPSCRVLSFVLKEDHWGRGIRASGSNWVDSGSGWGSFCPFMETTGNRRVLQHLALLRDLPPVMLSHTQPPWKKAEQVILLLFSQMRKLRYWKLVTEGPRGWKMTEVGLESRVPSGYKEAEIQDPFLIPPHPASHIMPLVLLALQNLSSRALRSSASPGPASPWCSQG